MNYFKSALFISLMLVLLSMKSDKKAWQYFNEKGKKITYDQMMKKLVEADVVFFGELHNNAISHWMELEIAKDLVAQKKKKVVMGAEMFESDQQLLINEYLSGKVSEKNFESQARLWPNHSTDYAPVLEVAKDNKVPFIATNIPRRYAAFVNKNGLDKLTELDDEAKKYIAPLPIKYDPEVGCYKEMMAMMAHMPGARGKKSHIAEAQAIKDATMAHFILQNHKEGQLFFHFNGSYHSDKHEGIIWWLKQEHPELNILNITTLEQSNLDSLAKDDQQLANFILITDKDFTKTY